MKSALKIVLSVFFCGFALFLFSTNVYAGVTGPLILNPDESGSFTASVSDPDCGVYAESIKYEFNWGDGTPNTIVGPIDYNSCPTPSAERAHSWSSAGSPNPKTVTVTATDKHGLTSIATHNVTINRPPTVNAGSAHSLTANQSHTHSGASATDPDNNLASFEWSFFSRPSGSTATLSGNVSGSLSGGSASVPGPTYTPDKSGTYTLRLTVTDSNNRTGSADVSETAVVAPPPQCSDGIDNDGDGRTDLDDPDCQNDPNKPSEDPAQNAAPVSESGISTNGSTYASSITVTRGQAVSLWLSADKDINGDAKASLDPNGWTHATFGVSSGGGKCEWNTDLNQGSPTYEQTITNPASAGACNVSLGSKTFNDTPGTYTYQVLRITDRAGGVSNVSLVSVTIVSAPNQAPTAAAGSGHSITVGSAHTHSGASALDPDNNLASFTWSWVSRPTGSSALLSGNVSGTLSGGATAVSVPGPTYTPDKSGTYTLRLTVTDSNNRTGSADVSETAVVAPPPQCSDGIDNDGDGRTDLDDPDCQNDPNKPSEDPAQNAAPVSEAGISTNGSTYTSSITVTKGQAVSLWLSADKDINGDAKASLDPNGWTHATFGVSSGGGKCEWNTDLNQGSPTYEQTITNPASAGACNVSLGSKTFNDTPGTYTYQVLRITDRAAGVSNVSSIQVTVVSGALPDLTIPGEININPSSPQAGNSLSFSVTVWNVGDATAGSSQTRLRLDVDNNGSWDIIPSTIVTGSMPPNSSDFEQWINVWTATVGTHKAEVCADSTNVVAESSETNNCVTKVFTVSAVSGADLIVSSMSKLPSNPRAGEEISFTGTIRNQGTGNAPVSKAKWRLDASNDGDWDIDGDFLKRNVAALGSGQESSITWDRVYTAAAGTHRYQICADVDNQVSESNEGNNCREEVFTIAGVTATFQILDFGNDPPPYTLTEGEVKQLKASYDPDGPSGPQPVQDVTNQTDWTSTNAAYICVNNGDGGCSGTTAKGQIKAQAGSAGQSANINAMYGGLVATANVSVQGGAGPLGSCLLSLNPSVKTIKVKDALGVAVQDEVGNVSASVDKPDIVEIVNVSNDRIDVRALARGRAVITATDSGVSNCNANAIIDVVIPTFEEI